MQDEEYKNKIVLLMIGRKKKRGQIYRISLYIN